MNRKRRPIVMKILESPDHPGFQNAIPRLLIVSYTNFVIVFCTGKPLPTVSWFVNERLVDGRVYTTDHRVTVNKLEIPRMLRAHLNSTYKCQASNTNLVLPTQKTVRLELIRECSLFNFFFKYFSSIIYYNFNERRSGLGSAAYFKNEGAFTSNEAVFCHEEKFGRAAVRF